MSEWRSRRLYCGYVWSSPVSRARKTLSLRVARPRETAQEAFWRSVTWPLQGTVGTRLTLPGVYCAGSAFFPRLLQCVTRRWYATIILSTLTSRDWKLFLLPGRKRRLFCFDRKHTGQRSLFTAVGDCCTGRISTTTPGTIRSFVYPDGRLMDGEAKVLWRLTPGSFCKRLKWRLVRVSRTLLSPQEAWQHGRWSLSSNRQVCKIVQHLVK